MLLMLALAAGAGVMLIILGDRLRIPAIALLLPAGILLGPQGLGLVQPGILGHGLETVVKAAVAVILFEGGLTLDVSGFRRAPVVIARMLTIGVLVTWLGTALALYAFTELSVELAILGGTLVSVTGPTVVSPLLRRVRVRQRLHHVLYWEGVLVDFVGVFLAVLVFEWVAPDVRQSATGPLGGFALRLLLGAGAGYVIGRLLALTLERHLVPAEHASIFTLAMALLVFGACDAILAESGILAVIVAGLVVAVRRPPGLIHVRRFKHELTELAIGVLFMLLAANLDLRRLPSLGWPLVALLAVVLLVVRPANVWVSTWGRDFTLREKLFLSWVAPRGIVAASMASLVTLQLTAAGHENAWILQTFTFAIIGTTVLLQGLTAGPVARLLRVERAAPRTWLLAGEPDVALPLGRALRRAGVGAVALIGEEAAAPADEEDGPVVVAGDPLDPELPNDPRFGDVGAFLALFPNPHLDELLCARWREALGIPTFRWGAAGERSRHVVWADLPSPTEVARALGAGDLRIEAFSGEGARPLFRIEEARAALLPAPEPAADAHTIALRRVIPGIADIRWEAVVLDGEPAPFRETIDRLARHAADAWPGLRGDALRDGVLAREQTMTTAIGHGVLLPHAYVSGIDGTRCLVAVAPRGLDLPTPDDRPARLVFLLLSPAGQAEEHLRSLAALARLVGDEAFVEKLVAQRAPADVLRLVRSRG